MGGFRKMLDQPLLLVLLDRSALPYLVPALSSGGPPASEKKKMALAIPGFTSESKSSDCSPESHSALVKFMYLLAAQSLCKVNGMMLTRLGPSGLTPRSGDAVNVLNVSCMCQALCYVVYTCLLTTTLSGKCYQHL